MSDRLRLHISPLNPTLLAALVPSAALKSVDNISYHTLETFPERNFGYVELPRSEAERMRKKYNGSILKGAKVHIEEAREKKKGPETDGTSPDSAKHKRKRIKTAVREDGVLPGFELPADRQVQRGWTKPSSRSKSGQASEDKKQKTQTSTFTSKEECLFKTTLPANVASTSSSSTRDTKSKLGKRTRKDKLEKLVVVHEFSNTTKQPSFIRDDPSGKGTRVVSEFVAGKGWVDEKGNLIEDVQTRHREKRVASHCDSKTVSEAAHIPEAQTTSSYSSKSSRKVPVVNKQAGPNAGNETSSSGTSSGSQSSDEESSSSDEKDESIAGEANGTPKRENVARDVHPLEAIFKRPKPKSSPETPKPALKVSTSFNFFEPDAEDATGPPAMPQTPFTQQDFQDRRQRSAAPTPDTAAPGKAFTRLWSHEDDDADLPSEASQEDGDGNVETSTERTGVESTSNTGEAAEIPQSDFAKWFWEHRGETNRAWKKRRREAAKEKRHRENKRHGKSVL